MVNIRNIHGNDAFLHVLFRKALGYLRSLGVFHSHYNIRPLNLLFCYRVFIIQSGGFSLEPAFEKMFGSFASILVLVADEKDVHICCEYLGEYKIFGKSQTLSDQLTWNRCLLLLKAAKNRKVYIYDLVSHILRA